jgi:hypothetical protein
MPSTLEITDELLDQLADELMVTAHDVYDRVRFCRTPAASKAFLSHAHKIEAASRDRAMVARYAGLVAQHGNKSRAVSELLDVAA